MDSIHKEKSWKELYAWGGAGIYLTVVVMVVEMLLTALPEGSRGAGDVSFWFSLFEQNWFMAMRNLGLLNIIATCLTLPVYFSLMGLHKDKDPALAGLALLVYLVGLSVFLADNVAFPMLALSRQFMVSGVEEKRILLAAGEALLAKGISHTPGTFPGFVLSEISGILMSLVILRGDKFKKRIGILGICSFTLLLLFECLASFFPSLFGVAMIIAVPTGLMTLIWYIALGRGLFKAARTKNAL